MPCPATCANAGGSPCASGSSWAPFVGSTLVLVLLMPALLGNISAGVLGSKEASALAEATAARSEAQRILDATPAQGSDVPASRTIDAVVAAMAARGRAGRALRGARCSPPSRPG